jgi:pimeloyl-ACP methyl ester carboxylesterase
MKTSTIIAATAAIGIAAVANAADKIPANQAVRNVVLVHGAFADGSGWRGVYDNLTQRGYKVTIVQNPLTSFADDIAATKRAIERQDGPTILVGHSWGGVMITEAGIDPKVTGLVYVSALSPDAGETTAQQYEGHTTPPEFVIEPTPDGFGLLKAGTFKALRPIRPTKTRHSWKTPRCRSICHRSASSSRMPHGTPSRAGPSSLARTRPSTSACSRIWQGASVPR